MRKKKEKQTSPQQSKKYYKLTQLLKSSKRTSEKSSIYSRKINKLSEILRNNMKLLKIRHKTCKSYLQKMLILKRIRKSSKDFHLFKGSEEWLSKKYDQKIKNILLRSVFLFQVLPSTSFAKIRNHQRKFLVNWKTLTQSKP